MKEEWRPVVGLEGAYEVSNFGRVRSLDRIIRHGRGKALRQIRGRMLRQGRMKSGHFVVAVVGRKTKRNETSLVHHLVLEAFKGPRPQGQECLHGDGDPTNNHIDNLRWGTRQENVDDAKRHGTRLMGERCSYAILKDADIPIIRQRCRIESPKAIAIDYGVSRLTINNIKHNRAWKHIK
jgi:hypothetical protein